MSGFLGVFFLVARWIVRIFLVLMVILGAYDYGKETNDKYKAFMIGVLLIMLYSIAGLFD